MVRSLGLAVLCLPLALVAALPAWGQEQKAARHPAALGVAVEPTPEGADQVGYVVRKVMPGEAAATAGLQQGDVITAVDGKPFGEGETLPGVIAQHKPGDKVSLRVLRGGKEKTFKVTLGEQRAAAAEEPGSEAAGGAGERQQEQGRARPFLGVFAVGTDDLSARLRKRMDLTNEKGVVITEIAPDSPAEKAGLEHGDVITAINGKAVSEPEDLRAAIAKAGPGKTIRLSVLREKEKKELTAKVGEAPFPVITHIPSGPGGVEQFPGRNEGEPLDQIMQRLDQLDRRLKQVEKQLNKEKTAPAPNRENR
jgi:C-terminal processing protease CtpA/Prc